MSEHASRGTSVIPASGVRLWKNDNCVLRDISMVLVVVFLPSCFGSFDVRTHQFRRRATIAGGACSGSTPYSINSKYLQHSTNSEYLQRHAM